VGKKFYITNNIRYRNTFGIDLNLFYWKLDPNFMNNVVISSIRKGGLLGKCDKKNKPLTLNIEK
jgi:hypothetical protein